MNTQTDNIPSKGMMKVKSFFSKAYYVGLCNKDGKLSIAKCLFATGSLAYFVFINPMMLAAIAEILIIFGMIMFFIKLFFTPNCIIPSEDATSAQA